MISDVVIAIILGVVEGVTEFLPVSSTGHLIVVGALLGFEGERAATFSVVIQLGAMLAIAWLYRDRLLALASLDRSTGFTGRRGIGLLTVTTIPALILGALAHGFIRDSLFTPLTVAIGWGAGGVLILAAERWRPATRVTTLDGITWSTALAVGLFQCLSLWPGMSRSATTMVGGLMSGARRDVSAEYSFLAALPVIGAASLFELVTSLDTLTASDIPLFATGFVVSFATAWLAVRTFLKLLQVTTLRPFGWYRIAAAGLLFAMLAAGNGHLVS